MTHPQRRTPRSMVYTIWVSGLSAREVASVVKDIREGLVRAKAIEDKKPMVFTFLFINGEQETQRDIKIKPRHFETKRRLKRLVLRVQEQLAA